MYKSIVTFPSIFLLPSAIISYVIILVYYATISTRNIIFARQSDSKPVQTEKLIIPSNKASNIQPLITITITIYLEATQRNKSILEFEPIIPPRSPQIVGEITITVFLLLSKLEQVRMIERWSVCRLFRDNDRARGVGNNACKLVQDSRRDR